MILLYNPCLNITCSLNGQYGVSHAVQPVSLNTGSLIGLGVYLGNSARALVFSINGLRQDSLVNRPYLSHCTIRI